MLSHKAIWPVQAAAGGPAALGRDEGVAAAMTVPVQPFITTFPGTLDAKGRVCIPAAWRAILTAQGTPGVYVLPSFIDPALDCFGQTLLDETATRLAAQDPFLSPAFDDEATTLISRTHILAPDENGRVVLPDALIAHAALKDRVLFAGKVKKFQIWDAERYAALEAEAVARMRARYAGERGQ
jgi:MraZ protein